MIKTAEERTGSIYILRNTENDKVYIGQTIRPVSQRFQDHLKPCEHKRHGKYKLYRAMEKIGYDKFYCETLESGIPISKLDEREIYYIELYDSYKNGYNSTTGGDGRVICKIQDVEKIKEMFDNGALQTDIADEFGVHVETIRRLLHSEGVYKRGIRSIPKDELEQCVNDGLLDGEIAEKYGVCRETVHRAKKKYGLRDKDLPGLDYRRKSQQIARWHEQRRKAGNFNLEGQLRLF